jgi:hypothetical protein
MTPISEDIKTQAHNVWARVQKAGFWWLIIFMLGASIGFKVAEHLSSQKFDDAIELGGVIHKTIVYDVKLRP